VLAIANGSTHGNIFDKDGNPIEQVSIDIPRTKEVAKALRDNNLDVRIAQHGITGTPRRMIAEQFPHGDIIKGNVGTFWMNLVWDVLKEEQPDLYQRIWDWTLTNYSAEGKSDVEVFGKNGKFAIKEFFKELYSLGEGTVSVRIGRTKRRASSSGRLNPRGLPRSCGNICEHEVGDPPISSRIQACVRPLLGDHRAHIRLRAAANEIEYASMIRRVWCASRT